MHEIIVDNSAGGGGAFIGIEMVLGRSVDIAINHDENAVAMYRTNHPDTLHYCESVFDVSPGAATNGKPIGLTWFSPDCCHFSKAKGAKPVEKTIRGLAWTAIRWTLDVGPRVMILKSVEEFKTWGPLLAVEMRPDPDRVGETFEALVGMLTSGAPVGHPTLLECYEFLGLSSDGEQAMRLITGLGYNVDYHELRACDYGAPTIRKRFFMVMRWDGQPIVWSTAIHGDSESPAALAGKLAPWHTAAECTNWSIPTPSIFDRKKPLAANTLKRIARGIQRFVVDSDNPFIIKCNHTTTRSKYNCFRGQGLYSPIQATTKAHGYALAVPTLAPFMAGNGGSQYQVKSHPLNKPAHTILKHSRACVVAPVIIRQLGASIGHRADEPSATTTAGGGGKSQLVTATLIQMGYGERVGQSPWVLNLGKPLGTATAGGNKLVVITAFLAKHHGGNYTGPGVALGKPAHSVTTVGHHALVTSYLVKLRGTCRDGQRTDEPMLTIAAGDQRVGEVSALLVANDYDERCADQVKEFLSSFGVSELVTTKGIVYRIVDIGMRMLQPHELYHAQEFPEWYIIDQDYRGIKYAKGKQVARCDNAVSPSFAKALMRANLSELCVNREEFAA